MPELENALAEQHYHVPELFKGETVVCIATGPSLCEEDVDYIKNRAPVIAINNAYEVAPWCDILYAGDYKWWGWYAKTGRSTGRGAISIPGLKLSLYPKTEKRWPDVKTLYNAGTFGLDDRPWAVKTGQNSGYAAINLAVHTGAKRIVLIGYDQKNGPQHFFGQHPTPAAPGGHKDGDIANTWRPNFNNLVEPLKERDIEIVNCTRDTALECFPMAGLRDIL